MGVRIRQSRETYLQRLLLPLLRQSRLLPRRRPLVLLLRTRVLHQHEREAVEPVSSLAATEGLLCEEGAEEGKFGGVLVLRGVNEGLAWECGGEGGRTRRA